MRVILFAILSIVSISSYGDYGTGNKYVIKYGILAKGDNGIYYVKTQTTDIPYITESKDKNFKFGYTVEKKYEGFLLYTKITMPLSKSTYIDKPHLLESGNKTTTVTTKNKFYKNESHELIMSLEDGDLPGLYKMEIFINNDLYKTIKFTIRK